jgi:nucleoside 2-deoxyribosyltransferase
MSIPIYLSGSISGGREDVQLYIRIADALGDGGFEVISGQVADESVTAEGETGSAVEIYARDLQWIDDVADRGGFLVAEVSRPSHGVGYEIAYARFRKKIPVVCLWRAAPGRRCSAMIAGDPGLDLIEYREDEIGKTLVRTIGEKVEARRIILEKPPFHGVP